MIYTYSQTALLIIQTVMMFFVGYLDALMVAAWTAKQVIREGEKKDKAEKFTHFALLVPAHNEEVLLPALLESIRQLDYPLSCYSIHVIADNCTDQTVSIARSFGAQVHERFNDVLIGKGYALEWGLKDIQKSGQKDDAYIIVDADSAISSNFLRVMNRHALAGEKVVQAYYGVKDPGLSWNISIRYAALAVLHFLRPQGRMVFGGSAGLKGNGMLFTRDVLAKYPWPASITEDIEYHMILLLNGYIVKFAPDASVYGEMPVKFEQSQSQLDRWEHGRLEMLRKYVPKLLKAVWQSCIRLQIRRAYCYLDATLEHFIPPFSILFSSALGLFLLDLLLFSFRQHASSIIQMNLPALNVVLGFILITGQIVYLISGLKMVNAPPVIYRQLIFAPLYIVRKASQYFKILSGRKPEGWVKTTRNSN